MVSALLHALTHTGDCLCWAGEPEVMQFNLVTKLPGAPEKPDVSFAAQGAFQCEGFTATQTIVNLLEQQTRGLNGTIAGFERRKAARNFIGIKKPQTFYFLR